MFVSAPFAMQQALPNDNYHYGVMYMSSDTTLTPNF
jgi:hypothetical protein